MARTRNRRLIALGGLAAAAVSDAAHQQRVDNFGLADCAQETARTRSDGRGPASWLTAAVPGSPSGVSRERP